MKTDTNEHNVYFLRESRNQELAKQFEWSRSMLDNNNQVVANYTVFQGELVYYMNYDFKRNKKVIGIAIALDESRDFQNEVFICPLIPMKSEEDMRLGVPFGKIYSISDQVNFVAAVGGIRRINKNYVKPDEVLQQCWVNPDFVNRVMKMYTNLLDVIINQQTKITKELTC